MMVMNNLMGTEGVQELYELASALTDSNLIKDVPNSKKCKA